MGGEVLARQSGNLDFQQGAVLLATEHVPVAGTAARSQAVDIELDRVGDITQKLTSHVGVKSAPAAA